MIEHCAKSGIVPLTSNETNLNRFRLKDISTTKSNSNGLGYIVVSTDEEQEKNENYVPLTNNKPSLNDLRLKEMNSTKQNDAGYLIVSIAEEQEKIENHPRQESWGNEIEFLFSCISLSVGLGNIWRFPFIAFQNGGGAFVIPYLIVLLIIGRPIYYMEILIGQFSGRGCFKAFGFAPILKGVPAGQIYTTICSLTYYSSIMALTLRYFVGAFSSKLEWSYCRESWKADSCSDSMLKNNSFLQKSNSTIIPKSSAELYFLKEILHEKDNIDDGIGLPDLNLSICLAVSWLIIAIILIKGIQSSGKAAYFLGIFPYVILLVLLGRAITLPGALNGIWYFFKPQWKELLNPQVWYAAVTQVFFSLAICFGTLISYASYNRFSRNVYKDIIIITCMDSCSSLIAGCITFGILGNLALETNTADISKVVKGGAGLAFISYPDALAKFEFLPQIFSALFFIMLFVLGIGSTIGMSSSIIKVIRDHFIDIKPGYLGCSISIIGFSMSLVYVTQGGQFILNLVDFYGASFVALVLAIGELLAVGWIYGIKRFCQDIEFMFGIKTGIYWRLCWGVIAPVLMISVLVYTLIDFKPLAYKNIEYPAVAHVFGWIIAAIGLGQLPFWALRSILKQPSINILANIKLACQPEKNWGPSDPTIYEQYKNYRLKINADSTKKVKFFDKIYDNIFG